MKNFAKTVSQFALTPIPAKGLARELQTAASGLVRTSSQIPTEIVATLRTMKVLFITTQTYF
jgi:hypothetical protein